MFTASRQNDLSDPANYSHFCELLDIDSLIDWVILVGVSASTDIRYNVKAMRSTENGGKWQFAFYDLDQCMNSRYDSFTVLNGTNKWPSEHMTNILKRLYENPDFIDAF